MTKLLEYIEVKRDTVSAIAYSPYALPLIGTEEHDNLTARPDLGEGWVETRFPRHEVTLLEDFTGGIPVEEFIQKRANVRRMIFAAVLAGMPDPDNILMDATLSLAFTGFSQEDPQGWRITKGAYESANALLATEIVNGARKKHPGANIILANGASFTGVDRGIKLAAVENNVPQLDFTAPEYAPWVLRSKRGKVMVLAPDKRLFTILYSACIDVLVITGGRQAALDLAAEYLAKRHRPVGVFPLLPTLSVTGGLPSLTFTDDGESKVLDAALFLNESLLLPGTLPIIRDIDILVEHAVTLLRRPIRAGLMGNPEVALPRKPVYVEHGEEA